MCIYKYNQVFFKSFHVFPLPIGKQIVWLNLREEPVVYVNNRPFVLRNSKSPYSNLEHRGMCPLCIFISRIIIYIYIYINSVFIISTRCRYQYGAFREARTTHEEGHPQGSSLLWWHGMLNRCCWTMLMYVWKVRFRDHHLHRYNRISSISI